MSLNDNQFISAQFTCGDLIQIAESNAKKAQEISQEIQSLCLEYYEIQEIQLKVYEALCENSTYYQSIIINDLDLT